ALGDFAAEISQRCRKRVSIRYTEIIAVHRLLPYLQLLDGGALCHCQNWPPCRYGLLHCIPPNLTPTSVLWGCGSCRTNSQQVTHEEPSLCCSQSLSYKNILKNSLRPALSRCNPRKNPLPSAGCMITG